MYILGALDSGNLEILAAVARAEPALLRTRTQDDDADTPIEYAAYSCGVDVVKWLLEQDPGERDAPLGIKRPELRSLANSNPCLDVRALFD